jgi:hypothetical protein
MWTTLELVFTGFLGMLVGAAAMYGGLRLSFGEPNPHGRRS